MVLKKKTKASSTGPPSAESVEAVDLHPKEKKIEKLDKMQKKKSHPKDIKFMESDDKKKKAVDDKKMKEVDLKKKEIFKTREKSKSKDLRRDRWRYNLPTKRVKKKKSGDKKGFSHYIHKVLKSMQAAEPQSADSANKSEGEVKKCTLSTKGMAVCDSMMQELCDRLSAESISLLQQSNKKTLTALEMRAAVRLTLPGELANQATLDGQKAVANYTAQKP